MKKLTVSVILIMLVSLLVYRHKKEIVYFGKNVLKGYPTKNKETIPDKRTAHDVWGIDISHHQRKINWDLLVEKNKPHFIFLKCTEGATHQDILYPTYKSEANKRGIPTGAYHFFSYQTPGKKQAENFIRYSKLQKGDLFPVLDIEYKTIRPSDKEIRKQVKEFCKIIQSWYGVNPIIYCEYDYYNNILKSEFGNYNYWISDLVREPRCNYVFWQFTERGRVEGIGNIDNNRLNKNKELNDYLLKE